jgi:16S rRNA (uracil1498-N3)-methyltransferase
VVEVRLFPGLPKVAKLELIIQKCTEIGVASVQPVQCRRSVPQPRAEEVGRKLGRWERVAKEAARQSGRTSAPAILPPRPFPQAVADFAQTGGTGLVFSPHEAAGPASSARLLPPDSPEPIGVFVGPEGGFTEEEVAAGVALGFHAVSLGRRTLRAETAAIVACAILMYELGELR